MPTRIEELLKVLRVPAGKKVNLRKDYDPGFTGKWMGKDEADETLVEGVQLLAQEQDKLYAQDNYGVLMILQAMDAAGKDGTIKHVMSGVNPQGVDVHSYKAPAGDELDHDFLWRHFCDLPRRGHIGIFNRSYYEEVLIVRVHPEFLAGQKLPPRLKTEKIWKQRFEQINYFEKYLVENGVVVLKIFLNVSKEEQGRRFLDRATQPEKNWKFSAADMKERERWEEYMDVYQEVINHTSSEWAPWYIVPGDNKWFTRLAVAAILYHTMKNLNLAYPTVSEEQKKALELASLELEKQGITANPEEKTNNKKKNKSSLYVEKKKKKGKKKDK
jgi:PPK2 family polyphosphate:nucleotide phosphotransferase